MSNYNTIGIMGRLTTDAEFKHFDQGKGFDIAEFSIAVNHYKGKDKEDETSFINVKSYNHSARFVSQYCSKGDQILIDGEIKQDRWEKDGKAQSKVYINAKNIILIKKKGDGNKPIDNEIEGIDF